jgi:hypothetical protein
MSQRALVLFFFKFQDNNTNAKLIVISTTKCVFKFKELYNSVSNYF